MYCITSYSASRYNFPCSFSFSFPFHTSLHFKASHSNIHQPVPTCNIKPHSPPIPKKIHSHFQTYHATGPVPHYKANSLNLLSIVYISLILVLHLLLCCPSERSLSIRFWTSFFTLKKNFFLSWFFFSMFTTPIHTSYFITFIFKN